MEDIIAVAQNEEERLSIARILEAGQPKEEKKRQSTETEPDEDDEARIQPQGDCIGVANVNVADEEQE